MPEREIHVGLPNLGDRGDFLRRVDDILNRRWLSNGGKYTCEFERRVAELLGVKYCVATCNATVALQIAVRALGLNGEIIMPSFTFIATAHALRWLGLTPVFCEVAEETHNIDPAHAERLITDRTSAILAVHLWGRPCNVDALTAIAEKHGLRLFFDASHALGVTFKGKRLGSSADLEVFSFHATKFINTLEGGAITTNDRMLADTARKMRNFGFTGYDQVDCLGTNGKMNEISAAMGLTNLEQIDNFIAVNRRNYYCYQRELAGSPFGLVPYNEAEEQNYQYVVVLLDEARVRVSRDEMVQLLHRHGIIARRYFYPGCHRQPPYCATEGGQQQSLPVTERLAASVICLPTGAAVAETDIHRICALMLEQANPL